MQTPGATPRPRFVQRLTLPRSHFRAVQRPTILGPQLIDTAFGAYLKRPAALVVGHPGAGRTWVRLMLAVAFERVFAVSSAHPLDTHGWAVVDPRLPRVVITRGRASGDTAFSEPYPTVVLARDPRDVCVSCFFRAARRAARFAPLRAYRGDLAAFIRDDRLGLPAVVAHMNGWARRLAAGPRAARAVLVRYEHLHCDTALEFGRLLTLVGFEADAPLVERVVRASRFEAARRLEVTGRLGYRPTDAMLADPDSLILRRGVVGGFRDHFDAADHRYAQTVLEPLDPVFGYGPA